MASVHLFVPDLIVYVAYVFQHNFEKPVDFVDLILRVFVPSCLVILSTHMRYDPNQINSKT